MTQSSQGREGDPLDWARLWAERDSSLPLYAQVRELLAETIQAGQFPTTRPMTPSRQLAELLGVSRNTVDTALQELVARGLLVSHPRRGLFAVPLPSPEADPDPAPLVAKVDWNRHLIPRTDPWPAPQLFADYLDYPYPFLPGQIEPRSFPARAWLRAANQAMSGEHLRHSLRDAAADDDELLISELIEQVLPMKGIKATPEQLLITSGTQQALALISQALLQPGRRVGMENPGYIDAARIFHLAGAEVIGFDVDWGGVRLDGRTALDVMYVTPGHQHPTNVTLSARRRTKLLAEAQRRDFVVIEDDFDSEVRYRGRHTPALRAQDPGGRVVYLGTFSKFLASSLRMGYVVAEPALIQELRRLRYLSNKHPSGVDQRTLALFIASGDYQRALRDHRLALKRKWETVSESLATWFPWPVEHLPTGGRSFWLSGPDGYDATALAVRARARGVLVLPGAAYHLQSPAPRNQLRLGFNAIPQARIEAGIRILAECL